MNKKIPPQNIEAEQSLLGAILLNNEILDEVRSIVSAEDFYRPEHRVIFNAIEDGGIDIVSLCHLLKERNNLDKVGGPAYIAKLSDVVPAVLAAVNHAKSVNQCARKRRFISKASAMVESCYSDIDFSFLTSELEQEAFALGAEIGLNEEEHIGVISERELARLEAVANKEISAGLSTGYQDIDVITGGLQPADLIILAARPSMGKTALAMNIVENVAAGGVPVNVFSLEMSKAGLGCRMLSGMSGVNTKAFQNGWVGDGGRERMFRAAKAMQDMPIYIDDSPALHISEIRSRARRAHRKHGIRLVVVDYIQMARGEGGNREQQVADISRGLKAMGKELDVPVLALAQLSRSCESRVDKRPLLSDLRESGGIEQDADVVAFIYRDEYYNTSESNPRKGIAELLFRKQRNGPTGTVELMFNGKISRFMSLARGEQ